MHCVALLLLLLRCVCISLAMGLIQLLMHTEERARPAG